MKMLKIKSLRQINKNMGTTPVFALNKFKKNTRALVYANTV